MDTKTITLSFEVPGDLDTPSEVKARIKQVIIEALIEKFRAHCKGQLVMSPDKLKMVAFLTEEN